MKSGALAILLLAVSPAAAQSITSAYTDLDLGKCRLTGRAASDDGSGRRGAAKGMRTAGAGVRGRPTLLRIVRTTRAFSGEVCTLRRIENAPDSRVGACSCRKSVHTFPEHALAEKQCAAQQTFGAFNRLGPTIEWRLDCGKPFATILRWHTEVENEKHGWLVVSRLVGEEVAYVDVSLPGANFIARQQADLAGQDFDCSRDRAKIVSRRKIDLTELVSGTCDNIP